MKSHYTFDFVLISTVFICFLMLNPFNCYSQDRQFNLKIGSNQPENSPESLGIARFIELAAKKSNSKIKITPYYGNILGTPKTQLENVMSGAQDMYVETYTYYQPFVKGMAIHSLPYLFRDNEHYRKFLESDIEREMEVELTKKTNIRVLNTKKNWIRGPYRVLFANRPVRSLKDILGLKIRVPDSTTQVKAWTALGAKVTVTPWTEIYISLKQGLIDAATAQLSQIYANKFTEVAKYVTVTHEYQQQFALSINNKLFESLPKELQSALTDAANETGDFSTEIIIKSGKEEMDKCKKEHAAEFIEIDLKPWRDKMLMIHEEFVKEGFISGEILKKAKAIQ
jgi:tripartite ATP-independent transporter DctP family solute receptor